MTEIIYLFRTIAQQQGGPVFTAPVELYLDEHNVYEPILNRPANCKMYVILQGRHTWCVRKFMKAHARF